jgi:hypothetical protein
MTKWRMLALLLVVAVPALAAERGDSFGAIAFGAKNSSFGDDYGPTSAEDAKQKALAYCARKGDDCKLVTSFSNICAAVAVVDASGATFVATDAKRGNAENLARQACTKKNPSGCRVGDSICAER